MHGKVVLLGPKEQPEGGSTAEPLKTIAKPSKTVPQSKFNGKSVLRNKFNNTAEPEPMMMVEKTGEITPDPLIGFTSDQVLSTEANPAPTIDTSLFDVLSGGRANLDLLAQLRNCYANDKVFKLVLAKPKEF